jgi:hypothetical protein
MLSSVQQSSLQHEHEHVAKSGLLVVVVAFDAGVEAEAASAMALGEADVAVAEADVAVAEVDVAVAEAAAAVATAEATSIVGGADPVVAVKAFAVVLVAVVTTVICPEEGIALMPMGWDSVLQEESDAPVKDIAMKEAVLLPPSVYQSDQPRIPCPSKVDVAAHQTP